MKRIALLAFAAIAALSANAQLLQYGIKGGINQTNPNMSSFSIGGSKIYDDSRETGYQFGAFARVKILMLYFQPEINYSVQKSSFTMEQDGGISKGVKYRVNTFNVPLLIGMKIGPLRINAGPMYNRYLKTNDPFEREIDGLTHKFNKSSWGYAMGAGVDLFKIITADLRYEGSFENQSSVTFENVTKNLGKPRNISITVGIFL